MKKNKNKNIRPANSKGLFHGYQEHYSFFNDEYFLNIRCMAKNNKKIGYVEDHFNELGKYKKTSFHIR